MRLRAWSACCFVVVFLMVAESTTVLRAQSAETGKVADCLDESLELSIHFYRAPVSTHVIALNYLNRGDTPCRMRVFRHQNGTVPQLLLHNQNVEILYPRTTVQPGSMVHSSFRWKTEPVAPDKPCEEESLRRIVTGTPRGEVILRSRTLSPRICDWLQDDDDYHSGPFVPEWTSSPEVARPASFPPSLSVSKTNYLEREVVTLRVKLNDGTEDSSSCPVLVQTARDEQGGLRMDEVFNPEDPDLSAGQKGSPRASGGTCRNEFAFQVPLGSGVIWSGAGKHTFGIVELSDLGSDGEYRQAASAPVTIDVVGVKAEASH